ncbi:MAG: radical SAM protein [Candidatus Marinimicrobia bacterium]|nr:radical SAM protein [Candidatus Neomarinimicrobiota bacterium]
MKHLIYGITYLANYWFLGKSSPLICGLVLHNKCNLRCRHCTVVDRTEASMNFDEVVKVIDSFYSDGGRCLYLQGGEPFIWHDNPYTMEDVVRYAKKKGYYTVIIYTNGTRTLESGADTIFVSVDGLLKTHDSLRGKSFERILNNIQQSHHPSIYINYTINSVNKSVVADFCEYVDKIPQIRGTFFYFHTPYYGYDELNLDTSVKNDVLLKLLKLKKQYKILNSTAGLKSAIRNDWKKKLDICQVYEDGEYFTCCRENNNGAVCAECGYLSYAEIDQTLKLKPGAIVNALKYF